MNRLFVLFVSIFVMASVLQADQYHGQPFERLYQELGDLKVQAEEAKEAIQAVPEMVYAGLRSGSKHWVSPFYWVHDWTTTPVDNEKFEHEWTNTAVYILNSSRVYETMVKIKAYDKEFPDKVCVDEMPIPPSAMISRSIIAMWGGCDQYSHYGWLEIVADREVFIDGVIFSQGSHMAPPHHGMPSPAFTTRSGRTMTWYPVDSE